MDKIQEKTVKFLHDVRRKKVAVENRTERNDCKKESVKNVFIHNSNISSNNCSSCQKVFYSPNHLLKHIMRRHPDDLIQLHRKYLKPESNNTSLGLHDVLKVFQGDLSKLREELIVTIQGVKVSQSGYLDSSKESYLHRKYESQQHVSTSMDHKCGDWHNVNDSRSNELQIVKEKVIDLESNIQCLCNKFEELDTLVKDRMLSKQDIHKFITANESEILKTQEVQFLELRSTLDDKLHNMLSNQLQQNSMELQSQYSKLKDDIARIDQLIDSIRKQIDSPYYLKDLEKKFNDRIINFLERGSRSKRTISKTRLSKHRNKSDILTEKFKRNHVTHFNKSDAFDLRMLEEKMSFFGISPSTCKMSSDMYKVKMKSIECEKKQNLEKNRNFSKIYDELNLLADHRTKLQQKKYRKLRFSVPLISNENESNTKKLLNKPYPNVENDNFIFSEPSKSVYLKSNLENIQNVTCSSSDVKSCKFVSDISKSDKCFRDFQETHIYKNELQPTFLKEHESTRISDCPLTSECNESVYLKSNLENIQNVTHSSSDIKSCKFVSDVSRGDKCFRDFQETHFYKNELQPTVLKQHESTRIADCPLTSEHFEYEEKCYSLARDSESSSNTLEDHKGKGIITEPAKYFPEENELSDANSLYSLSEWESDKDNS